MFSYTFAEHARRDIKKLPKNIQRRIIEKLDFFVASKNPLTFAHPLTHSELGQYRFRVGAYRIVFDVESEILVVLAIDHRKDIYR